MTFIDALAQLPLWLRLWIALLLFSIVILPAALLLWRQSRIAALLIWAADLAAGFAVSRIYDTLGYVKLLGLPHIVFWVPLTVYLFMAMRRADMPPVPRRIIGFVLAMFALSLAFDITDVIRYLFGERTPLFKAP